MIFDHLRQIREGKRLKAFYERYERLLIPGFLLAGFFFHILTFRVLEEKLTFIGLGVYSVLAAAAIVYGAAFDARVSTWTSPFLQRLRFAAPLVVQLAFGSLFSMSLLFYWYSGAFASSWPILAVVTGLIVSNETFRHLYARPSVQVPAFTLALFCFFSLLFPFTLRSLDISTFLIGGVAALIASFALVAALARVSPEARGKKKRLGISVTVVYVVMNALYFLNVIPPMPLALREAGVYHQVTRVNGNYQLEGETQSFLAGLLPGQTLHKDADGTLYAYTAVFAPGNLSTTIFHRWEFYDEEQKAWITRGRPSFNILGGRSGGYRGYTRMSRLSAGKWRVTVETARGQALGRIPFTYEP